MGPNAKIKNQFGCAKAAQHLGVSTQVLERWYRNGSLPGKQKNGVLQFNKKELQTWADKNNFSWIEPNSQSQANNCSIDLLSKAIERGGTHHCAKNVDAKAALKYIVNHTEMPEDINRGKLLKKILEREKVASTGFGNGIAIPHPRKPIGSILPAPIISIWTFEEAIPFNAIDGEPVSIILLLLSSNTKIHLHLLSKLGMLIKEEHIIKMINKKRTVDHIVEYVDGLEKKWL